MSNNNDVNKVIDEIESKINELEKDKTDDNPKTTLINLVEKGKAFMESDKVKESLANLTEKGKELSNDAMKKFDEVKADPKVNNMWEDVKSGVNKVSEKVSGEISNLKENEEFMGKVDQVKQGAIQGLNSAKTSIDGFVAKPEVQESLDKAKEKASSAITSAKEAFEDYSTKNPEVKDNLDKLKATSKEQAGKAVNALKGLFAKKD